MYPCRRACIQQRPPALHAFCFPNESSNIARSSSAQPSAVEAHQTQTDTTVTFSHFEIGNGNSWPTQPSSSSSLSSSSSFGCLARKIHSFMGKIFIPYLLRLKSLFRIVSVCINAKAVEQSLWLSPDAISQLKSSIHNVVQTLSLAECGSRSSVQCVVRGCQTRTNWDAIAMPFRFLRFGHLAVTLALSRIRWQTPPHTSLFPTLPLHFTNGERCRDRIQTFTTVYSCIKIKCPFPCRRCRRIMAPLKMANAGSPALARPFQSMMQRWKFSVNLRRVSTADILYTTS